MFDVDAKSSEENAITAVQVYISLHQLLKNEGIYNAGIRRARIEEGARAANKQKNHVSTLDSCTAGLRDQGSSLVQAFKKLGCYMLRGSIVEQSTNTLAISCLPQYTTSCGKICQVTLTQFFSSPSPHLLDWVQVK